jgi:glutamate-1-semialdehyde aminotransferase
MSYTGADIDASYTALFDQAKGTVEEYMQRAARDLDSRFGEGYAKKNPVLMAAMIRAMSDDFTNAARSKALLAVADRLTLALEGLATSIEGHVSE